MPDSVVMNIAQLKTVKPEAGVVAAGIVQPAGGLQVWLGQCFQTAVAGQAEQEIGVRIVEGQLHQFHVGKMGVTAQQDAAHAWLYAALIPKIATRPLVTPCPYIAISSVPVGETRAAEFLTPSIVIYS